MDNNRKKPEVLAPASSLEVLKTAVYYGADAVYIGGEMYGLRAKAKNFSKEDMAEGIRFAHEHGKKVYVTANITAHDRDLEGVQKYFEELKEIGPDALIISDPGVFQIATEICPEIDIHISTQANNVNYRTFRFWHKLGATRVVTARELSIREIADIDAHIPEDLEIETFVHGAMCISYSGRCLLSNYFTGRDANLGACTHPCRWKYYIMEENRPGEYLPVEENERGTYIFNSKDLCMIEHIPELVAAGVDSFKIEGRAKSAYYTAVVTHAYRQAMDAYFAHPSPDFRVPDWVLAEMEKMSHRVYTTGFNFGPLQNGQELNTGGYVRNWDVCALYRDQQGNRLIVDQRNRFFEGDILEVLEPGQKPYTLTVRDLVREADGTHTEAANKATEVYSFAVDRPVSPDAILRRKRDED